MQLFFENKARGRKRELQTKDTNSNPHKKDGYKEVEKDKPMQQHRHTQLT
jgi:hypothetical protein